MEMSTQRKGKWTCVPGKTYQRVSVGERLKGEDWNKVVPTNAYAIHNPHGPPVSRDMSSTDSKR